MSLSAHYDVPVLIVGAGPTGLLAANLLGTYGVPCLVVERNSDVSNHPKAILLDDEGFRAMQSVSLAEEIAEQVIQGYGARYYDSNGACFAKIEAPVTENGYYRRNSFLQPDLERVLLKGLDRFDHVTCMFETELAGFSQTGEGVIAEVRAHGEETQIHCQYLLGCDGGRSFVRHRLSIKMPGRTDPRDWVVIDTIKDPDRDRFSKFFCDPARPMVSIPAPDGGRRYEFMIMEGEDPEEMARAATVHRILSRFRPIPEEDIIRCIVYTFHARVAERFQEGRCLLLGDAAHLSPPFAGQGMNAGLRDAFNVAWKITSILRGQAPASIIDTYQLERHGPAEEMIDYAVALGGVVMPKAEMDEAAKEAIADALGTGVSGQFRPKPQAVYNEGWLLKDTGELAGRPLPQPEFRLPDGTAEKLDNVLGTGFALMSFGGPMSERLSDRLECKEVRGTGPDSSRMSEVAQLFGTDYFEDQVTRRETLLVRPDRFVAAQFTHDTQLEVEQRILSLFNLP